MDKLVALGKRVFQCLFATLIEIKKRNIERDFTVFFFFKETPVILLTTVLPVKNQLFLIAIPYDQF